MKCSSCKRETGSAKKTCPRCLKSSLRWQAEVKRKVMEAYGHKCQCPSGKCHESHIGFLTIDHVNDDGKGHRIEVTGYPKGRPNSMYRWLLDHGCPKEGFRILCWNCNFGRARNGGVCPHEELSLSTH